MNAEHFHYKRVLFVVLSIIGLAVGSWYGLVEVRQLWQAPQHLPDISNPVRPLPQVHDTPPEIAEWIKRQHTQPSNQSHDSSE